MPAAGVPLSVPVPLPLSTKVTPAGSVAPPSVIVGRREAGRRDGERAGRADREGRRRRAGDRRRLAAPCSVKVCVAGVADRRWSAVKVSAIAAAAAGGGRAGERGGAVAVVGEASRRQAARRST